MLHSFYITVKVMTWLCMWESPTVEQHYWNPERSVARSDAMKYYSWQNHPSPIFHDIYRYVINQNPFTGL